MFGVGHTYFAAYTKIWVVFNDMNSCQVISDKHLQLFTEDELERLLCGERDSWLVCTWITFSLFCSS